MNDPPTRLQRGSAEEGHATPLGDILARLGSSMLTLVYSPGDVETLVAESVLHDVSEPVPMAPHGVLLAVGGRPGDPSTRDVIDTAARHGFGTVVMKARGEPLEPVIDVCAEASMTLLVAPDELSWRHLDAMLSAAMSVVSSTNEVYAASRLGDLFGLANAIASWVGGAITIEDHKCKVLAYSNIPGQHIDEVRTQTILGRRAPDRPHNSEEYDRVYRNNGTVRFSLDDQNHTDRLAVAVRAGDAVIGSIWALDGTPPLRPDAEGLLEEAARVAALYILTAQSRQDLERQYRAEILRGLLTGGPVGSVAGTQLGLDRDTPTRVFALAHTHSDAEAALTAGRLVDLVSLHCHSWHPRALCAVMDGVLYGLLPDPTEEDDRSLLDFGDKVVAAVSETLHIDVCVAIGPRVSALAGVPQSRDLADQTLKLLSLHPDRGPVATAAMLRSAIYLSDMIEQGLARDERLLPPITQMIEHDAEQGTDYVATLMAYFDAFGNISAAAQQLVVHENTVRYRLQRAVELFNLDLDDPDERLVMWLQLRLCTTGDRSEPLAR